MAAGPITNVAAMIIPDVFTPYSQQRTVEKSRIVSSGVMVRSPYLDGHLNVEGSTVFSIPSYKPLDSDEERTSTDTAHVNFDGGSIKDPKPQKIETALEKAVRLSRNQSWSVADLATTLAGDDIMSAIGNSVGDYWQRRLQYAVVATMNGVLADNDASNSGDYTHDVSGGSYVDGLTTFTAENFIDALATMGDSVDETGVLMVSSTVYYKILKNGLIDFIADATNPAATEVPRFLKHAVIIDDGLPSVGNVFESWIFGKGALQLGVGQARVPTAVKRHEGAGNGGGQETLYNRVEWSIHPTGHAYVGTSPSGGPSNAATTHNLAHEDSWNRVYSDRRHIRFCRLKTLEA